MKIGVISDTHIPFAAEKLPQRVCDHLKDCDLILHAGDVVEMSVIEDLQNIAETKVVCGNMDNTEVRKKCPERMIFEAEGKKIGLVHGRGPGFRIMETVCDCFDEKLDIIIFGHSHKPVNEVIDGVLYFNPGSVTDSAAPGGGSFGMIYIEGDEVRGEIIQV